MSPLLPIVPATVEPTGSTINRQFVIEINGGKTLRDGGGPAPAPDARDVTVFHVVELGWTDDEAIEIGEPNLPGGIDYALWSKAVKPASREGFAESSDIADLFDD